MKLYKTNSGAVIEYEEDYYLLPKIDWNTLINRDNLHTFLKNSTDNPVTYQSLEWFKRQTVVAPIDRQEIWAAGEIGRASCRERV